MSNKAIAVVVAVAILMIGGFAVLAKPEKTYKNLNEFAKCLAEKEVTMYGAAWCSHCQNEKRAFGEAFKYVPYVECPREVQKCQDMKVGGYPTWIWPDGKRLEGEQGVERLAAESGCRLE